jgi:pseudouridine-5'-phosphate glycosidase
MRVRLSPKVEAQLENHGPVVALETSVVAQGLPYPENLEAARACEEAVRWAGAEPAAIAVIDGDVVVGLSPDEMRRLAEGREKRHKVASRDLASVALSGELGGTTVSASIEVASRVGIRVFATGGIGGVHRGLVEHLDVSADLMQLARTPVAVVCAGAKSVLDLPKTLEALEALSVPVVGVRTNELPSFYSTGSGLTLEHRVEDAEAGAELMAGRFDVLGQGGIVFTLPPPTDVGMPRAELELHVAGALAQAEAKGVRGKAVTPFLLAELAKRTGGKSLRVNVALLANNARFAGELAMADSRRWARAG